MSLVDIVLNEDQKELLQSVESSSQRINKLVEDLLSFSSSGKFPEIKSPTDLNQVLIVVENNISDLIESKSITRHADYYFCGPKPFMVNIYHDLLTWGIPETQVHFEFFGPKEELQQCPVH